MDPFIRTVIGKSPTFEQLKPHLPSDVDTFYELYVEDALPTFGAVDAKLARVYRICSGNDLILNIYWRCRNHLDGVINQYNEFGVVAPSIGARFYELRNELNLLIDFAKAARKLNTDYVNKQSFLDADIRLAALALYFNHIGLNGRVAVNSRGRVTTQLDLKVGELPDLQPRLRRFEAMLDGVCFSVRRADPLVLSPKDQPFAFNWSRVKDSDFVFINGYREKKQVELNQILRKARMLSRLRVLTMNYDTPAIRSLYNDFDMCELKVGKSKRLLCW